MKKAKEVEVSLAKAAEMLMLDYNPLLNKLISEECVKHNGFKNIVANKDKIPRTHMRNAIIQPKNGIVRQIIYVNDKGLDWLEEFAKQHKLPIKQSKCSKTLEQKDNVISIANTVSQARLNYQKIKNEL